MGDGDLLAAGEDVSVDPEVPGRWHDKSAATLAVRGASGVPSCVELREGGPAK